MCDTLSRVREEKSGEWEPWRNSRLRKWRGRGERRLVEGRWDEKKNPTKYLCKNECSLDCSLSIGGKLTTFLFCYDGSIKAFAINYSTECIFFTIGSLLYSSYSYQILIDKDFHYSRYMSTLIQGDTLKNIVYF